MTTQKLSLHKETLRQLTALESDHVAGGMKANTYSGCLTEEGPCGSPCTVGRLTVCVCSA
jgi:hypothetical protein